MKTIEVNNWSDVDSTLRRLAEIEIQAAKINGNATLEINAIKEKAKKEAQGLLSEQKHLENLITI